MITTISMLRINHIDESTIMKIQNAINKDMSVDEPIFLNKICEVCGLDIALKALRAASYNCERAARLIAIDFAKLAIPVWTCSNPNDNSPQESLKAAMEYANDNINSTELYSFYEEVKKAVSATSSLAGFTDGEISKMALSASKAAEAVMFCTNLSIHPSLIALKAKECVIKALTMHGSSEKDVIKEMTNIFFKHTN
jgi:hypothetical protein